MSKLKTIYFIFGVSLLLFGGLLARNVLSLDTADGTITYELTANVEPTIINDTVINNGCYSLDLKPPANIKITQLKVFNKAQQVIPINVDAGETVSTYDIKLDNVTVNESKGNFITVYYTVTATSDDENGTLEDEDPVASTMRIPLPHDLPRKELVIKINKTEQEDDDVLIVMPNKDDNQEGSISISLRSANDSGSSGSGSTGSGSSGSFSHSFSSDSSYSTCSKSNLTFKLAVTGRNGELAFSKNTLKLDEVAKLTVPISAKSLKDKKPISIDVVLENHGKKVTTFNTSLNLSKVAIKEISFGGAKYHELKADTGTPTYSAPHWVDTNGDGKITAGEKNYSVAYTANSKPSIAAKFSIKGFPDTSPSVKVRASSSSGNIKIDPTTVTIAGDTMTLPQTESSTSWPDEVKFYSRSGSNAFQLDWEIKVGDADWVKIGSTKHQVYVILGGVSSYNQESIVFHATRNADGMSAGDEANIVDAIYKEFTDRIVSRIDPTTGKDTVDPNGMKYWGRGLNGACYNIAGFLKQGNTTCGTWAKYMSVILKVHAINCKDITVYAAMPRPTNYAKILKDFNAAKGRNLKVVYGPVEINKGKRKVLDYRVLYPTSVTPLHFHGQDVLVLFNNGGDQSAIFAARNAPTAKLGDLIPIGGNLDPLLGSSSAGQGNPNARNWFGNHAIIWYGGYYYDPSYGSPKQRTKEKWEYQALQYHGILIAGVAKLLSNKGTHRLALAPATKPSGAYFYVDREDRASKTDSHIP